MKLERRSALIGQIKALQNELSIIDDEILAELSGQVKQVGSTTVIFEGQKVTVVHPVTVKWDQTILRQLTDRIKAGGDDPENYIDLKFNVKETIYKTWPDKVKELFIPARTVTPGKPRLEVKS